VKLIIRFVLNLLPCRCICDRCGWLGPNRGLTKEGRKAAMRDLMRHGCKDCISDEEAVWIR
jgi:hypothetical protein